MIPYEKGSCKKKIPTKNTAVSGCAFVIVGIVVYRSTVAGLKYSFTDLDLSKVKK
jgi:hypothetical protein